jgi:hypothetical protein
MGGYPLRALIGVAAAAVLCLIGAFGTYDSLITESREFQDYYRIEAQQRRFAGVNAALPPETVVGYISDLTLGADDWQVNFFGVQYALAPRLLVEESDGHKTEWVVGNFLKKPVLSEIEKTRNLKLVKEFGMGVYLFRTAS